MRLLLTFAQRTDHKEQRAEDRADFDRRTDALVRQLRDPLESMSSTMLSAFKNGGS